MNSRGYFLIFVFTVFSLILLGRLIHLQIIKGEYYYEKSEKNHLRVVVLNAPRGNIYDRNGILLAYDKPSYNLYTFPYITKKRLKILERNLKRILNIELSKDIKEKIKKGNSLKVVIKKNLTDKQIEKFFRYSYLFTGIYLEVQPRRIYTEYARYMPHLIGYVGYPSEKELKENPKLRPDTLIGKSGVEKIFDRYLRGKYGTKGMVVDALGRIKEIKWENLPKRGNDIYLTVDARIQKIVYEAFKNTGEKSGAVIVFNPDGYEILALLSYPIYDIQKFSDGLTKEEWKEIIKNPYKPLLNKALKGIYPPGSIFKIVVGLGALNEGVITPNTRIYSGGKFKLGNFVFRNWNLGGCGRVNVMEALETSCDTFFYQISLNLGVRNITKYTKLFGIGEKLNPEIEKRVAIVPTPEWKRKRFGKPWYPGDTIVYSIGQGYLSITPFDGAKIIAPIANGGKIYRPKLLKAVHNRDTGEYKETEKVLIRKLPVKQEYIKTIKRGIYLVVYGNRGTAKLLSLSPVKVAGKTGTAQVIRKKDPKQRVKKWKYQNHAWYVSLFPYDKPRFAMSVFVEHGIGGSKTAVPITKYIIDELYRKGIINEKY
ncbi:MAG: penicillin-binding protein 2 [Persephonella sp.]|nr:MAG: penicillin-binding protein 2 [Persephonella sp.]RUM62503.1 MAG: penicillin-binding protein 2 [Persephonella sp.]